MKKLKGIEWRSVLLSIGIVFIVDSLLLSVEPQTGYVIFHAGIWNFLTGFVGIVSTVSGLFLVRNGKTDED